MAEENNGGGGQLPPGFSQVVLTFDRAHFTLQIGGHTENYDEALCIVEIAAREFEARIRAARAGALLHTEGRIPLDFNPRGPRRA